MPATTLVYAANHTREYNTSAISALSQTLTVNTVEVAQKLVDAGVVANVADVTHYQFTFPDSNDNFRADAAQAVTIEYSTDGGTTWSNYFVDSGLQAQGYNPYVAFQDEEGWIALLSADPAATSTVLSTGFILSENPISTGDNFVTDEPIDLATYPANQVEEFLLCFTPDGVIETAHGPMCVGDLEVGDKILTRDNGYQELRWIYYRQLAPSQTQTKNNLAPVVVKKDAFGPNVPERDMKVSPGHMLLVSGDIPQKAFGEPEVLIPAKKLLDVDGVYQERRSRILAGVTYVHLVFDAHEIVHVDGMWSESFRPSPASLELIHREGYQELLEIFPELTFDNANELFPEVRHSLYARKAKRLANKMAKNRSGWTN